MLTKDEIPKLDIGKLKSKVEFFLDKERNNFFLSHFEDDLDINPF